MSAQCPINSATVDTLGQYNQAARHLISACRVGTTRLMHGAAERYEQFVGGRSLLSDGVKERLIGVEQGAGNAVLGVVSRVADTADNLADSLAQRAVAGLEQLDEKMAWSREVRIINALRQINLPVAKASLKLAENVADVSRRLSERVAGQPEVVAKTVKAAKAGAKKARAATRAATRATTRATTKRVRRAAGASA